jgi:hypothetical protein
LRQIFCPAARRDSRPVGRDFRPVGRDSHLAGRDSHPTGRDTGLLTFPRSVLYMKMKRTTWNSQDKQRNRDYMKKKRSAQTSQDKQENREYMKDYIKKKRFAAATGQYKQKDKDYVLKKLISKFHDTVSKGPTYVCTCCDQLWYKHSVSNVDVNIPRFCDC